MSDMTVTLTVTVPMYLPGDDEVLNLAGAAAQYEGENVDPDDVPVILLAAVEQLLVARHREWLNEGSPMGNADMIGALASMNARVEMHATIAAIPFAAATGMETTLPG